MPKKIVGASAPRRAPFSFKKKFEVYKQNNYYVVLDFIGFGQHAIDCLQQLK